MSEKKPKVLFIAPAQSSKTTHMILDEAKKEFDCTLVPIYELTIGMNKRKIKIMHKGRELRGYDYIFPRIDSKRAEYGYDIISAFDYTGVKKTISGENHSHCTRQVPDRSRALKRRDSCTENISCQDKRGTS